MIIPLTYEIQFQDIEFGVRRNSNACPLANATSRTIKRQQGLDVQVDVLTDEIQICDDVYLLMKEKLRLSGELIVILHEYDNNENYQFPRLKLRVDKKTNMLKVETR